MDKMSSKMAAFFAKKGEKGLAKHEKREAMGKEKDTKAIAMKEKRAMKGAPKNLKQYEAKEHKGMGFAKGGKVKRYAEGGMEEMAQPSQAQTARDMQMSKMGDMGGMGVVPQRGERPPGLTRMAPPPPPSNTKWQDARLQARTADLQGRGVGQKQIDAMQQRMQGRFDDRNKVRMGGPGNGGEMPGQAERQMVGAQMRAFNASQQAPASMGAPDTQSPGGFAKGGRVKANGIARKGKTRGRII